MRRSTRLQVKQDSKSVAQDLAKMSLSGPPTTLSPAAPELTPFGTVYKLPPELRHIVWDLAVNSEQDGVVDCLGPCRHEYGIAPLSKAIHAEAQPIVEAAQSTGCKHTDFAIKLPSLEDIPEDGFEGELLETMQEREALSTRGHDITQANILVFETGHLGDDAPDSVTCYLERGEGYFSYDIIGGTISRRNHVEEELVEAMDDVKKALGDSGPIVDVYEQGDDDDDEPEDPIARKKRSQTEAMTYLAESVRSAICEPIDELEEPRLIGPGRGIRYGFKGL